MNDGSLRRHAKAKALVSPCTAALMMMSACLSAAIEQTAALWLPTSQPGSLHEPVPLHFPLRVGEGARRAGEGESCRCTVHAPKACSSNQEAFDELCSVGISVSSNTADPSAVVRTAFDPEFMPLSVSDTHGAHNFTIGEFSVEAGLVLEPGDRDWMTKFVIRRGDHEVYHGKVERLVMALHDGQADLLLLRISRERDIQVPETRYLSIHDGQEYTIEGLLQRFDLSLPALHTLLGQTSIRDHHRMALLLDAGADINRIHPRGTLLNSAVIANSAKTIRFLLERGADPEVAPGPEARGRLYVSWTALHLAAYIGHTVAAELLLDFGADLNRVDDRGDTPAMLAAHSGHTEILELFLRRGLDPYWRTANGRTLLHHAAEFNRLETAMFLLGRGLDPQVTDSYSYTPLDSAVCRNHVEMVTLLIDHGEPAGRPRPDYRIQPRDSGAQVLRFRH
jgi:ankyrin repeat protein